MSLNLKRDQLYDLLPAGVISLDERGLIQALVAGFQERVADLRSYSSKLNALYSVDGLPDGENNVVLADMVTPQGVAYTQSLDTNGLTPSEAGDDLTAWAADQLGVELTEVNNVRYGRDLLRLVDADTLAQLAETLGAVLHASAILAQGDEQAAYRRLVETYFPRLQVKGTARSMEQLGRVLGFDDIQVIPLWSRVAPRLPSDIGNVANDADFSSRPEQYPHANRSVYGDPTATTDGPGYAWRGTCSNALASTAFYDKAVNGYSPFITCNIIGTTSYGTIVHPEPGEYRLAGGAPNLRASVIPEGSGIQFQALFDGADFNDTLITVSGTGTYRVLDVEQRLSAIKRRSSYFDLGMTVSVDDADTRFGSTVVRPNAALIADPDITGTTAVAPFRPWSSGSAISSSGTHDWITPSVAPTLVTAQVQAGATDRQVDLAALQSAGEQFVQSIEELRPATRHVRRSGPGYHVAEELAYAPYTGTLLAGTIVASTSTLTVPSGWAPNSAQQYVYAFVAYSGTTAVLDAESNSIGGVVYTGTIGTHVVTGTYGTATGKLTFSANSPFGGTLWLTRTPLSTESVGTTATGTTAAYQFRPEDETDAEDLVILNGSGTATIAQLDLYDDNPWLRGLVGGGELVDLDVFTPEDDVTVTPVAIGAQVLDHTGTPHKVLVTAASSGTNPRLWNAPAEGYTPGVPALAYSGTFRDLAAYAGTDTQKYGSTAEYDRVFMPGYQVCHAGLVNGVLVADPVKFNGPAHRDNLAMWLPFNAHLDDAYAVREAVTGSLLPVSGMPASDRVYDTTRGWVQQLGTDFSLSASLPDSLGTSFTCACYVKAYSAATAAQQTVIDFGLLTLSMAYPGGYPSLVVEGKSHGQTAAIYTQLLSTGWNAIACTLSGTGAEVYVNGTSVWTYTSHLDTFADAAGALSITGGAINVLLHDLRVWSSVKSSADLMAHYLHSPTPVIAQYPLSWVETSDCQDHYGLRTLATGWVVPGAMPPWTRNQNLAWVQRYSGDGRYHGAIRQRVTGLSGGTTPFSFKLGCSVPTVATNGTFVYSTSNGPDESNTAWRNTTANGTYLSVGSIYGSIAGTGYGTTVTAASLNPWPDNRVAYNSAVASAWVAGTHTLYGTLNGTVSLVGTQVPWVYEVSMTGSRSTAQLVATSVGEYGGQLETGATTLLSCGSYVLEVNASGTPYVKSSGTTYGTTAPLNLYLNRWTLEDAPNAFTRWTDAGASSTDMHVANPPASVISNGTLTVAARGDNGLLEFTNDGTLDAGQYALTIVSGNLGQADADFTGFTVEISLNASTFERTLLTGKSGLDFTGTDTFELEVGSATASGNWLMSINWLNAAEDATRGTRRQLAIYGYKLERLSSRLFSNVVNSAGSIVTTEIDVSSYSATIPGGWVFTVDGTGVTSKAGHESQMYPANDTGTSRVALSQMLTSCSYERNEQVLVSGGTVLAVTPVGALGSIGSPTAAAQLPPTGVRVGSVTGDGAVVYGTLTDTANSQLVRALVSTDPALYRDVVYSDVTSFVGGSPTGLVSCEIGGLESDTAYFCALEVNGSPMRSARSAFSTSSYSQVAFVAQVPLSGSYVTDNNTNVLLTAYFDSKLRPSYQWKVTGADIPGEVTNSISVVVTSSTAGTYVCYASTGTSTASSGSVVLALTGSAVSAVSVTGAGAHYEGSSVTLVATFSTVGTPVYQWYVSKDNGVSYSAIAGAVSATFSIAQFSKQYVGLYTCKAVNGSYSALTSPATLSSQGAAPVVIASQPNGGVGAMVQLGSSFTLSIGVANIQFQPVLAYQWYANGSPIPGANASSYTIMQFSSDNIGSYYCTVTNMSSSATSVAVALSAKAVSVDSPKLAVVYTATINSPFTLLATFAVGAVTVTYRWYKLVGSQSELVATNAFSYALPGIVVATHTLPIVTAGSAGTYYCLAVNNANASDTATTALITLNVIS